MSDRTKNPRKRLFTRVHRLDKTALNCSLVPTARLELARLSPLPPQDSVSTNSTTSAQELNYRSNLLFLQALCMKNTCRRFISRRFRPDCQVLSLRPESLPHRMHPCLRSIRPVLPVPEPESLPSAIFRSRCFAPVHDKAPSMPSPM